MQQAVTPDIFGIVMGKTWPLGVLFFLALFAPLVLRFLKPFRDLSTAISEYGPKTVSIAAFDGQIRRFENGADGNRQIAAFYKAKVLEARLRTELDDLFRSCCGWLLVHLILIVIVAAIVAQSFSNPSQDHMKFIDILSNILSLPLAEALVAAFCMMSLQRLAQEWREIAPELG